MSLKASWPLQQAIHTALIADTTLGTLVGGRIYDRPPQDVAFPYLTLGDTEIAPEGAEDTLASRHIVPVSVWSRANGRREAKETLSAISAVLTDARLPMTGHLIISSHWVSASLSYDREADALKGELRFRFFIEALA